MTQGKTKGIEACQVSEDCNGGDAVFFILQQREQNQQNAMVLTLICTTVDFFWLDSVANLRHENQPNFISQMCTHVFFTVNVNIIKYLRSSKSSMHAC